MFGAVMYMVGPFMRKNPEDIFSDDYADTPLHHLLSKKDSVYMGMKDLEFDYMTGKLSDEDYEALRVKMAAEATGVLEEIDALKGGADRKTKQAVTMTAQTTVETDSVAEDNKCGACGFAHAEGDKFCQSCGAELD